MYVLLCLNLCIHTIPSVYHAFLSLPITPENSFNGQFMPTLSRVLVLCACHIVPSSIVSSQKTVLYLSTLQNLVGLSEKTYFFYVLSNNNIDS